MSTLRQISEAQEVHYASVMYPYLCHKFRGLDGHRDRVRSRIRGRASHVMLRLQVLNRDTIYFKGPVQLIDDSGDAYQVIGHRPDRPWVRA